MNWNGWLTGCLLAPGLLAQAPAAPRDAALYKDFSLLEREAQEEDARDKARAERKGEVAVVGAAADFWNRYEEDFARCRELGLKAFRLGIEWSRVQPVREDVVGAPPSFDLHFWICHYIEGLSNFHLLLSQGLEDHPCLCRHIYFICTVLS